MFRPCAADDRSDRTGAKISPDKRLTCAKRHTPNQSAVEYTSTEQGNALAFHAAKRKHIAGDKAVSAQTIAETFTSERRISVAHE